MQSQLPQPVFLNLEYVFNAIYTILAKIGAFVFSATFLFFIKVLAFTIIILCITAILYALVRLYELKSTPLDTTSPGVPQNSKETGTLSFSKPPSIWGSIRAKLLSDTPTDWRLAIIEADIYLDRVLSDRGAHADTLGDKLKSMNENDFPSLRLAWEAHKVRNRIAHDGQAYTLTQPEARKVLSYYEIIFRDLGVI